METVTTFEDYKNKYNKLHKQDPLNPELESIKRDYLKGNITKKQAIQKMDQLKQKLINNQNK
jgi:hypothetical protein